MRLKVLFPSLDVGRMVAGSEGLLAGPFEEDRASFREVTRTAGRTLQFLVSDVLGSSSSTMAGLPAAGPPHHQPQTTASSTNKALPDKGRVASSFHDGAASSVSLDTLPPLAKKTVVAWAHK